MKFYSYINRYIIYRLYKKFPKEEQYILALSIISFTLALILYIQLFTIINLLAKLFPHISIFQTVPEIYAAIGYLLLAILYFIFIARKNRIKKSYEEFKDESISSRRKGTFLIILYSYGSFVVFCLVLLFLF